MISSFDGILQLVLSFLLLVPGFITYQVALFYGKISPDLDRFQQTAWSLVGSGVSISITILLMKFLLDWGELSDISSYSLIQAFTVFPVLVIVAIILGIVSGYAIDDILRSETSDLRESTWRYIKASADEPVQVRVRTNSGNEILGEVLVSGSKQIERDLLLRYPYRIHRSDGEEVSRTNIGKFAYIPESDIAHIYFDSDITQQ